MAHEKQQPEDKPRSGLNGFDPGKVQAFMRRIDACYGELAELRAKYQDDAFDIRQDIKAIIEEASDDGIPAEAMKAVVKTRQAEAKLAAMEAKLEADQRESYEAIRAALGDLADMPLGRAVTAQAYDAPREERV